jgi:hypothetical protein
MIGLQAKRLYEAQRKKLVTERKMKEGTLTVENPKRKILPSQKLGTTRSSVGVKRPQSDSSTSSQEMQQPPKKTRNTQVQTGTYKEAAVGIKIAIVLRHHPDINLDQAQTDIIRVKLLNAVDANTLEGHLSNFYTLNLERECFESRVQINPQRPG